MVYVRNHRHVTDVGLLVHDGTDLVDGKVHLRGESQITFTKMSVKERLFPAIRLAN